MAKPAPKPSAPSLNSAAASSFAEFQNFAPNRAFVVGADFTLADIPIGLSVNRWLMTPIEHSSLPVVLAYYERMSARPAFLKHGRNGVV